MAIRQLSIAESLTARLDAVAPIGAGPRGTTRLAWTDEAAAAAAWFADSARAAGLEPAVDPAGNLWACPPSPPPWLAFGSHLDSVVDGGRYDGALGVACGFEIAARSGPRIAVISFADEEGARFNTPTFGSRALAGRLDLAAVAQRTDAAGTTLGSALARSGIDPEQVTAAPSWLPRLSGLVEIHVDQTPFLQRAGTPVGLVEAAVSRVRLQVEVAGRADHAGTTAPEERRDALAVAAHLVVAAETIARREPGMIATATRLEVEPNATTTIAQRARLWLDARSPHDAAVDRWTDAVRTRLHELAAGGGTAARCDVASRAHRVALDRPLLERLEHLAAERAVRAPRMLSYAGHDACVLASSLPTAMILVRNPTGVSHAPEEAASAQDAAIAVELALGLTGGGS